MFIAARGAVCTVAPLLDTLAVTTGGVVAVVNGVVASVLQLVEIKGGVLEDNTEGVLLTRGLVGCALVLVTVVDEEERGCSRGIGTGICLIDPRPQVILASCLLITPISCAPRAFICLTGGLNEGNAPNVSCVLSSFSFTERFIVDGNSTDVLEVEVCG